MSFFVLFVFTSCAKLAYKHVLEISGGSMESVIAHDGSLSQDAVRRFGWHLVKGLKHIHELGIIFSDLTPAKVCTCIHLYVSV